MQLHNSDRPNYRTYWYGWLVGTGQLSLPSLQGIGKSSTSLSGWG